MTMIQIPCFTRNGRAGLRPRPLFLPESNSPDEGEVLVDTLSPASKKTDEGEQTMSSRYSVLYCRKELDRSVQEVSISFECPEFDDQGLAGFSVQRSHYKMNGIRNVNMIESQ